MSITFCDKELVIDGNKEEGLKMLDAAIEQNYRIAKELKRALVD